MHLEKFKTFLNFVGELKVTYKRSKLPTVKILSSFDAVSFIQPFYEENMDSKKEIKILHLDVNKKVINIHEVCSGSLSSCFIPVSEILRNTLLIPTYGIIFFSNQPSGDAKITNSHLEIAKQLSDGCKAIGIKFIDSVILTRETFLSLTDEEIMPFKD